MDSAFAELRNLLFDETLDVGVDLGTPVTDDYPEVDNGFRDVIHTVRIDLGEAGDQGIG